jgi:putative FmdB family regulatory protein
MAVSRLSGSAARPLSDIKTDGNSAIMGCLAIRRQTKMPLYEYRCTKCGEVCEVLQKVKDKPLEKCPSCGAPVVKRVSSPAIQFKGNGWYITDYAKKSSPASEGKTEPKSGAKTEAKAEKPKAAGEAAGPKTDKSSS